MKFLSRLFRPKTKTGLHWELEFTPKPLERWMYTYLLTGFKPDWAHEGIEHQDLRDMIASAIYDHLPKDERV